MSRKKSPFSKISAVWRAPPKPQCDRSPDYKPCSPAESAGRFRLRSWWPQSPPPLFGVPLLSSPHSPYSGFMTHVYPVHRAAFTRYSSISDQTFNLSHQPSQNPRKFPGDCTSHIVTPTQRSSAQMPVPTQKVPHCNASTSLFFPQPDTSSLWVSALTPPPSQPSPRASMTSPFSCLNKNRTASQNRMCK